MNIRKRVGLIAAAFTIAGGSFIGGLATNVHAAPKGAEAHDVQTYNDGWTDSKTDDCQQGSKAACDWLKK